MIEIERSRVLLSIQRALLGEITPGIRAISVSWDHKHIKIRVFHDGPWTNETEEDFDACTVTQVCADFHNTENGGPLIEYEFVRLDGESQLPQKLKKQEAYVYARNNEKWNRLTTGSIGQQKASG